MNEAVDRVLLERQGLDRDFSTGLGISASVHVVVLVVGVVIPLLFPARPRLEVTPGFAVALPPGGAGTPAAQPAPPAPAPPVTAPPEPAAPPPDLKKVVKPPKEEPRKGLPELDSKTKKSKKERERPQPVSVGGTGTATQTPGLSFGPVGPGVPGGMDPNGDWYLAGVQRKIWMIWNQQLGAGNYPSATVEFTIMADGSVQGLPRVVQSSGIYTVDLAAQRAISTAAPFAPLPKSYGTNAFTIRAVFKPEK